MNSQPSKFDAELLQARRELGASNRQDGTLRFKNIPEGTYRAVVFEHGMRVSSS
jgi:hypothetical protein